MGACEFMFTTGGKIDAHNAYRDACDEARDYYGHQEGYNGTISTTYGFAMVPCSPRQKAQKIADELINDDRKAQRYGIGKRENAGCIELSGADLKRWKAANPSMKGRRGVRAFLFFGWAAE